MHTFQDVTYKFIYDTVPVRPLIFSLIEMEIPNVQIHALTEQRNALLYTRQTRYIDPMLF